MEICYTTQGAHILCCVTTYKSGTGWEVGGGREDKGEGDIRIPIADSCCYIAETNTLLLSNYPPNKNKVFKKAEREKQIPYNNIYMWNLEK